VENDIRLPVLKLSAKQVSAVWCCNICGKCRDTWYRLYGYKIDAWTPSASEHWHDVDRIRELRTDNKTIRRHILACNLQPTSWRGAKVDAAFCALEERVFLVELNELERRTRTVPLLSNFLYEPYPL
jgi:hypothetical protein